MHGEAARPSSAAAQPPAEQDVPLSAIEGEDAGPDAEAAADAGPDLEAQVEEEKQKRIAHALQVLDGIPVGQAFCTMRVAKKTGQTLRPGPGPAMHVQPHNWTAQPARSEGAAAPLQLDLSSMLPGPAFGLPTPGFGAAPAVQNPTEAASEAAAAAAAGGDGNDESAAAGASRPASAATAGQEGEGAAAADMPEAGAGGEGAAAEPSGPTQDATLDMDASLDAKLMATWHFAEVRSNGDGRLG